MLKITISILNANLFSHVLLTSCVMRVNPDIHNLQPTNYIVLVHRREPSVHTSRTNSNTNQSPKLIMLIHVSVTASQTSRASQRCYFVVQYSYEADSHFIKSKFLISSHYFTYRSPQTAVQHHGKHSLTKFISSYPVSRICNKGLSSTQLLRDRDVSF